MIGQVQSPPNRGQLAILLAAPMIGRGCTLADQISRTSHSRSESARWPGEVHGPLKVSPDGRGWQHADATSFVRLGDTARALHQNLSREDVVRSLDDAAAAAFNVIQLATIMKTTRMLILTVALAGLFLTAAHAADIPLPKWKHISSKTGDLPEPNGGRQQTACVVFDIDQDGAADIVIAERTQAPSIVWLRHTKAGWKKYIIDNTKQRPEAGGWPHDVDGDDDLDLIIGGDSGSDELWWYENPAPNFDPQTPWQRRIIKKGGGKAHHDHVVADFKGTGKPQLMFWNQGAKKLFMSDVPDDPRKAARWPLTEILDTSKVKTAIKQEGMAAFDVDGDEQVDLLAGIYWFKHQGGNEFRPVQIADHPGRIAAGHFRPGKTAQIVLGPGDGNGPLWLIECHGDPVNPRAWTRRNLLNRDLRSGHTLAVADINADGNLDIFCAEMHTPGPKEKCTAWLLYGDGEGRFRVQRLSVGIGNHDSRVADVDGDGRLDIVTKPYTWDTPRVDVWLNQGVAKQ